MRGEIDKIIVMRMPWNSFPSGGSAERSSGTERCWGWFISCNRFDSYWRWYHGVAVLSFSSEVITNLSNKVGTVAKTLWVYTC